MDTLMQDLRHAIRLAWKQPGLSAIIIISLGLGIGANTMIFSLLNALLLRPLPYPEPHRLVILWFTPPKHPEGRNTATAGNCFQLAEVDSVFEHVGCFRPIQGVFSDDDPTAAAAELRQGETFSYGVLQAVGVQPLIGRWFTAEEDKEGAERVVIISYALWQRRFGGTDVIGRKVRVADVRSSDLLSTIIGIMPPGFSLGNARADYWVPLRLPPSARKSPNRAATLPIARLKPGVSLAQAQAAADALAVSFAEEIPSANKDWGIRVEPFQEAFLTGVKLPLLILQGVVGLVLLIACANVAGLLLAQGISRQKELALRTALGSTRRRIVRLLLVESVLLSVLGGLLGLLFAWGGLQVLLNSLPPIPGLPRLHYAAMDSTVLGFALLVSIMSAVVFGMLPAFQASRPDVIDALKDSSRGTTVGPSRRMLRSAFVVAQIATALVLLIGAGLMINSFLRLYTVNVGFNPHNVMTFQIRFAGAQYYGYTGNSAPNGSPEIALSERVNAVSEQIRQRLAGVAGVESSSAVAVIPPLSGGARVYPFTIEGQQPASSEAGGLTAEWFPVMPDYLRTLGIPVLRGRDFTAQDSAAAASVALISTTMAKRFFPNENPIGKRIQIDYYKDKPREIVGVVGDSRHNSRDQNFQPQIYVPYAQLPLVNDASGSGLERLAFLVRFKGSPNQLASSLRSAVGEVDPAQAQAAVNFKLLDELLADQLQGFLQYVLLLGVFAGIALVLAIAGIYGMMAHVVSQRTGELGIRIALGARRADVMALVLSRGLVLIAVGLTMGLGASLMLTRVIQSVLWGVTPTDPLTFAVVALLLAAIALLACYLPARRAAKTDPVVALRCE